MAWTKAKTAILSVGLAGLATISLRQHQAQVKLREQNESLRRQLDQFAQVAAENQGLSNLLAQATRSELLARNQLNERLARRAQEPGTSDVRAATGPANPPASPLVETDGHRLPKASWTNAGFAAPLAALQTRGWAVLNGDRDLFKQSLFITDDARKVAEDALVQMAQASTDPNKAKYIEEILNHNYGVEEGLLMPMMAANQNQTYTGYTILSQQSPSADEMILEVETEMSSAPAETQTLKFQRFGGDWKVVIDQETIQRMMKH